MTRTTSFKRIMCCFLALLMLCTCVLKPLEVKAVATEALLGLGLLIILTAATAGVVFHPQTAEDVVAIGGDFQSWAEQTFKTDEEWAEFAAWTDGFYSFLNDPDAPEDETPNEHRIRASKAVLAVLSAWIASVVVAGGVEVEKPLEDGWYYYCVVEDEIYYLPPLPEGYGTTYPVAAIWESSGKQLVMAQSIPYRWSSTGKLEIIGPYILYKCQEGDAEWTYVSGSNDNLSVSVPYNAKWANVTIPFFNNSANWAVGREPVNAEIVELEPIIIEEVLNPDENGEYDPEEIEKILPAVIDPSKLLYDTQKEDLNQAVQEVMGQLASGEMTYDQYMESIQPEPEDNPEDNPEDETQPGTSPDPTPDGSGDAEVKSGLRKLVDFFTGTAYVQSPLQAMNFGKLFDLFPFNIPAGIYQTINFWKADAQAPKLVLPTLAFDGEKVTGDEFTVDLAEFPGMNTNAALIRAGNLILFGIGLLLITRKVTKW